MRRWSHQADASQPPRAAGGLFGALPPQMRACTTLFRPAATNGGARGGGGVVRNRQTPQYTNEMKNKGEQTRQTTSAAAAYRLPRSSHGTPPPVTTSVRRSLAMPREAGLINTPPTAHRWTCRASASGSTCRCTDPPSRARARTSQNQTACHSRTAGTAPESSRRTCLAGRS